jgi:hypothetical protein
MPSGEFGATLAGLPAPARPPAWSVDLPGLMVGKQAPGIRVGAGAPHLRRGGSRRGGRPGSGRCGHPRSGRGWPRRPRTGDQAVVDHSVLLALVGLDVSEQVGIGWADHEDDAGAAGAPAIEGGVVDREVAARAASPEVSGSHRAPPWRQGMMWSPLVACPVQRARAPGRCDRHLRGSSCAPAARRRRTAISASSCLRAPFRFSASLSIASMRSRR